MTRQVSLKLKAQRFGVGRPVRKRAQVRRRKEEMRTLDLPSSLGTDRVQLNVRVTLGCPLADAEPIILPRLVNASNSQRHHLSKVFQGTHFRANCAAEMFKCFAALMPILAGLAIEEV